MSCLGMEKTSASNTVEWFQCVTINGESFSRPLKKLHSCSPNGSPLPVNLRSTLRKEKNNFCGASEIKKTKIFLSFCMKKVVNKKK